jgi:4'-phosphopantetheinyl transferase
VIEFPSYFEPADEIALAENELHVWRAWLDVDEKEYSRLASVLTEAERARANRYVFPLDRRHFTVARGTLRVLLGQYLQCAPADIRFETGRYGKLYLENHARIKFNLSHSYGLAVYAFAVERELGIDVEKIRQEFATEGIAERYFSAAERRELGQLPTQMRTKAFFHCWTRKEAYIKAHGDGLQMPLDSFDVSLTPGEPERLRSGDSDRWSLRSFHAAPEYIASIVGEGKFSSVRFWMTGAEATQARRLGVRKTGGT